MTKPDVTPAAVQVESDAVLANFRLYDCIAEVKRLRYPNDDKIAHIIRSELVRALRATAAPSPTETYDEAIVPFTATCEMKEAGAEEVLAAFEDSKKPHAGVVPVVVAERVYDRMIARRPRNITVAPFPFDERRVDTSGMTPAPSPQPSYANGECPIDGENCAFVNDPNGHASAEPPAEQEDEAAFDAWADPLPTTDENWLDGARAGWNAGREYERKTRDERGPVTSLRYWVRSCAFRECVGHEKSNDRETCFRFLIAKAEEAFTKMREREKS